jgi:hypothetical protein
LRQVANYGFSGAFYQAWRRQTPMFGHRNGNRRQAIFGRPGKRMLNAGVASLSFAAGSLTKALEASVRLGELP